MFGLPDDPVQNLNAAIFLDTIFVTNVKLCRVVVFIVLHPLITFSVTSVSQQRVTIEAVSFISLKFLIQFSSTLSGSSSKILNARDTLTQSMLSLSNLDDLDLIKITGVSEM